MWLKDDDVSLLKSPNKVISSKSLDQILSEILKETPAPTPPTRCPHCLKDLVSQFLPYIEIRVFACPNQHGAWIDPSSSEKLRNFLSQQISIVKQRNYRLKLLFFAFLIICGSQLSLIYKDTKRVYNNTRQQMEGHRIGEAYWPGRDFSNWNPLPIKEGSLDHQDELAYFQEFTKIMEEGIVNRYNIQAVMDVKRSKNDYLEVYDIFETKQEDFTRKLADISTPERLKQFHENVIQAAYDEITFYRIYAKAKVANPNTQLSDLLNDPYLKSCNEKLWAAYHEFQRIYPQIDAATNTAIESRLCQFDII